MDMNPNGLRFLAYAAALLALVGGLGACTEAKGTRCTYADGTSVFCPPESQCAAKQATCIVTPCGNNRRDPGEMCDDGNRKAGDGCSTDCTSNEECNNGIWDREKPVDEKCDPTAPEFSMGGCTDKCAPTTPCGDGIIQRETEECDDELANGDDQNCTLKCQLNVCGDAKKHATREGCDRGPDDKSYKADCPYGERACQLCSVCTLVSGRPHYCGDGTTDQNLSDPSRNEQCDDGVTVNPTSCPYGQGTCTLCNAACQNVTLTGPYCGNGIEESKGPGRGTEGCDNYAAFLCGTCVPPSSGSATSCTRLAVAKARGRLTFRSGASGLVSTRFSLDGFGEQPKVFEYTINGSTGGAVPIYLANGFNQNGQPNYVQLSDLAQRTAQAINDQTSIHAQPTQQNGQHVVELENELAGLSGNEDIIVTNAQVPANAANLERQGMAQGRGCRVDQPCATGADCTSSRCNTALGVCTN